MKKFIRELADQDTEEKRELLYSLSSRFKKFLSAESRIFTEYAERKTYSHDLASIPPFFEKMLFRTTPLLVIQPGKADDLVTILNVAKRQALPVFPRGIASWGLGGAVPTSNGIVIDFSPLDKIFDPDRKNLTITVEAGARWGLIDEKLRESNLQLAVTPTSRFSTVGGWISTGGYGLGSLGFGHLEKWVKKIQVATPKKGLITIEDSDEDFPIFFNTEGQLGLIYEVTLKLVRRIWKEYVHLLNFDSTEEAFQFAEELIRKKVIPATMNFKDADHIKELNKLWGDSLFPEKPSLLFCFISDIDENSFQTKFGKNNESEAYLARLLWMERYNPLKMHNKAPSILASEVILPFRKAPEYFKKARKLSDNFNISLFSDYHFIKSGNEYQILAMSLFNCDRRKIFAYYAYLSLVPTLTRLGIRLGGKPYGIGIWNSPFFSSAFNKQLKEKIINGKKKYDPNGIMNPRKFTSIRSRFMDIPAKIFHPFLFTMAIELISAFSPVLKKVLPNDKQFSKPDKNLLEESAFNCTGCGNCLTVCPAYMITKKESTSPRGKLSLTRRYLHGKSLSPGSITESFFCTKCRNCEKVCQSRINHLKTWDELESILKKANLDNQDEIKKFIDSMADHRGYLDLAGIEKWENL